MAKDGEEVRTQAECGVHEADDPERHACGKSSAASPFRGLKSPRSSASSEEQAAGSEEQAQHQADDAQPVFGGKAVVNMFEMTKLVNKHQGLGPPGLDPRARPAGFARRVVLPPLLSLVRRTRRGRHSAGCRRARGSSCSRAPPTSATSPSGPALRLLKAPDPLRQPVASAVCSMLSTVCAPRWTTCRRADELGLAGLAPPHPFPSRSSHSACCRERARSADHGSLRRRPTRPHGAARRCRLAEPAGVGRVLGYRSSVLPR